MAKITLFFQDLSKEKKLEIVEQLKVEITKEINEAIKNNDGKFMNNEAVRLEIIDDYINTHNISNEFRI